MAVDRELAQKYREEGKTLQEVADLVGCSLAWCKANLKGTKAPSKDKALIDAVRTKGKTREGVTSSGVRKMVREVYKGVGDKELEDKVADIKRAARRDNPDVLIRPYWMLPDQAEECLTMMLEYAQEVWQFKEYLADKYRRNFDLDSTYDKSVMYALTAMSAGERSKLMPQGLMSYGRQLNNIQQELESRYNGNAPQAVSMAIDFAPMDEYETQQRDALEDMEALNMLFPLE
jgi:predicted transcriptional regulator